MVLEQTQKPNLRALAGVLAVLSILVFGTAVFSQLQASLDKIWNRQGPFFRNLLIQRLISVGIFLVLVLFLFISFLTGLTIQGLEYRTSLSVSTLLPILFWTLLSVCLGGFYRWLSYRKMTWRASLAAGGIVASLLTLGKVGFRWYVTTAAIGSAYGAAGVFIIFLLWVFYTSLIFLIGAEIAFALTYNFFAHRVIK
jgi:membrane protein